MWSAKRKVQNECVAARLIKIIAEGNTDILHLALYTLHAIKKTVHCTVFFVY